MYKVKKNKELNRYEVEEINTEQTVFFAEKYADAYKKYRFFKEGGSFGPGGWTPAFMLKELLK